MKAVVSVTFDNQFAVHDIKVIYANEKFFIVMPSRKNADGTYTETSSAGTYTYANGVWTKACVHNWVDADCDTPKTCSVCGETEGEALGHDWVYATCTEPDTCNRCGETQGEALGHHLSEVSDFDEENHWVNCLNCDYKGEVEAHYDEDEDNACDYCGAEMPEEPENPENPENPEDPEEPENPEDKPEEDIPQTADVSMIGFIAILMLAACGLIVINKKNFA